MYKIIQKGFRITVSAKPVLFFAEYFFTFCDALLLALSAEYMRKFFDTIFHTSQQLDISAMVKSLCIFAGIKILDEIADGLSNFLGEYYSDYAAEKVLQVLNEKTSKLPAVFFEDTVCLEMKTKAYGSCYAVRRLVHVIMDILTLYLPYFVCMFIWLYRMSAVLTLVIPCIFFPVFISHCIRSKYYTVLEDTLGYLNRKQEHYKACITSRAFLKETRCFGAEQFFLEKYKAVITEIQIAKLRIEIKSIVTKAAAHMATLLGLAGIFILLIVLILQGSINAAIFSVIVYALMDMYSLMEEVFDFRLGELAESAGKIKNYFTYLDTPEDETDGSGCIDTIDSITFENVSFTYPQSEKKVLENIQCTINKHEMVVIVGENGSGKTTLSKLLLGLYRPSAGTIKLNGIDTQLLDKKAVQAHFSAVFQEHCRYALTVGDNVAIADFPQLHEPDIDNLITQSIQKADFRIDGIPDAAVLRLTQLGKTFGGMDVSGGQWQRLSTARCLFRNASILVLDEPSSAIDPAEEARILKQFLRFAENRTCVIISHRIGLGKYADNIIVMKNGRIVETGTHSALMQNNSEYARLYTAQAAHYQ